jgi:hypothetical protein
MPTNLAWVSQEAANGDISHGPKGGPGISHGANSHGSQSDIVLTDVAKADLIARGE